MLLNISSFILVLLLCASPPAMLWLVFKSQREPVWLQRYRKPVMVALLAMVVTVVVSMAIVFYEITQIQERLREDIREIQSTMQQQ